MTVVEFKPIQCDVCDKIFAARSTLQLHREILHDESKLNNLTLANKENEVSHKSILNTNLQAIKIKIEDDNLETINKEKDFYDVTLVCEDQQIQTHEIIQGLLVQFEKYHHYHQDYLHVHVRDEYQNDHLDIQTDKFLLERRSVLWTQVKVDCKIQRKSPVIKNQNKIFETF